MWRSGKGSPVSDASFDFFQERIIVHEKLNIMDGKMTTAMTLRIDAAIKKEATKYLEQLGLSTSEAVRSFVSV